MKRRLRMQCEHVCSPCKVPHSVIVYLQLHSGEYERVQYSVAFLQESKLTVRANVQREGVHYDTISKYHKKFSTNQIILSEILAGVGCGGNLHGSGS